LSGPPQPGEHLGRLATQLAGFQVAIYLVQEALERLEAGIPAHALLDGRLLGIGVAVQSAIALALAVLLAAAGRAAEAAGRALRPRPPPGRPRAGRPGGGLAEPAAGRRPGQPRPAPLLGHPIGETPHLSTEEPSCDVVFPPPWSPRPWPPW
jgi:hypothetical protein